MIDEYQYEIDLGDKFQKFEKIARDMVKNASYSSGVSVQIFSTQQPDVLWLGLRISGPVETDYDHLHKIDLETAKYLLDTVPGVGDWFNRVRERG